MLKSAVVIGSTTTHGGIITAGCETFTSHGKPVHLEGMKHFCPKCKMEVVAIAEGGLVSVFGQRVILDGDKASCGAVFIAHPTSLTIQKVDKEHFSDQNLKSLSEGNSEEQYSGHYQLINEATNAPMANVRYVIRHADSKQIMIKGITDKDGFTEKLPNHDKSQEVIIELESEEEW